MIILKLYYDYHCDHHIDEIMLMVIIPFVCSCYGYSKYVPWSKVGFVGPGLLLIFTISVTIVSNALTPPPESGAVSLWTSEFMLESSQKLDCIPIFLGMKVGLYTHIFGDDHQSVNKYI